MPLHSEAGMNQILIDWGESVREWEQACRNAATTKALYEHKRAAFKEDARKADPKLPVAGADLLADANADIYKLNQDRLEAEAVMEGVRKRLDWFSMRAKAAQTSVANEREEARVWASSPVAPGQEPQRTGDWT